MLGFVGEAHILSSGGYNLRFTYEEMPFLSCEHIGLLFGFSFLTVLHCTIVLGQCWRGNSTGPQAQSELLKTWNHPKPTWYGRDLEFTLKCISVLCITSNLL